MVKILRKECPAAFPVDVRRVKMCEDGYCSKVGNKFVIRINRELPEGSAIDTLMHEWAHARAWNHLHDSLNERDFIKAVHDAAWGVAYSEVYRIFEEKYDLL